MKTGSINKLLDDIGITIKFDFIPFSQSRNKNSKHPSLNYKAHLFIHDRPVMSTDYMQGLAHCKSYKQMDNTVHTHNKVLKECETGRYGLRKTEPETIDVMYCLVTDSDVLNYSCFADWADCFGCDPDSIKAKSIYDTCLQQAVTLHSHLDSEDLNKLVEAYEDF